MRKIFFIVILLLVIISVNISTEVANVSNNEIKLIDDVVTIGVANTGAPYLYKSKVGTRIGYNVDVLELLSKKLNLKFIFIDGSVEELKKMMLNQELDLILGLQYNSFDVDNIRYSKPFIDNHARIFVRATSTGINSFEDLSGIKVAVYKNDPSLGYLTSMTNLRIFRTESIEDAATMLKYKTVDAWVGNDRECILLLQNSTFSGGIKVVGEGKETFPSAIAAHRLNSDLIENINEGISDIKNSDELDFIESKWFGEILKDNNSELQRYLLATVIVSISLAIIVTIIVRVNQLLKKEVLKRTREIEFQKKLSVDMLQSLSDGVVTINGDKKILFINDKIHEFFSGDDVHKYIGDDFENSPMRSVVSIEEIDRCINMYDKITSVKKQVEDKDSKIYEYSLNPIELSDEQGDKITGATIVLRDKTEETVMKERMMTIDKLQSIGRMTADVAHEIRNPLTSISTYIKILPQKYDNESFREVMVHDMNNEINRINNIVNNLLNNSKVKTPDSERFNLSKEISSIVRLIRMQMKDDSIELNQTIDNRLFVKFDKNQFTQVCVNILSNAIEKLECDGGTIKIVGKYHNGNVMLSFEDSGNIISNESLESIFDPFYTTKENGNGLGLSIVNELVNKNEAEIRAYNSISNSPVFEIILNGELIYE